ncbi:hypothetical protein [Guyparkeria sp. TX1]|uniref:hypothetical protein n=1 Tax=Guyparkeria sp. TX1 TaxID=3115001 RepID=UPI003977E281
MEEAGNGVRVYEGKLDSISPGQVANGMVTNYALIEIGDDAPSNIKVVNGLDGKLGSSVGENVKLWVAKGGMLVGLENEDGKAYVIGEKAATKGAWGAHFVVWFVVGAWVLTLISFGANPFIGMMLGFFAFLFSFLAIPMVTVLKAVSRAKNGIAVAMKQAKGRVVEVEG